MCIEVAVLHSVLRRLDSTTQAEVSDFLRRDALIREELHRQAEGLCLRALVQITGATFTSARVTGDDLLAQARMDDDGCPNSSTLDIEGEKQS